MSVSDGFLPNSLSLAQKASALHVRSVSLSDSMRSGSSRSMYKGRGIDFTGVREYSDTDDVRAIDWNVTARMGKAFVKMFEEDRELTIFIVVDFSSSMESTSARRSRLETAAETAALIVLAAAQNNAPVGAVVFDGEIIFSAAPKQGKAHAMYVFSNLGKAPERRVQGSALAQALRGAAKLLKNRSLVMIISDFRCAGYEEELSLLSLKHEVAAVCMSDRSDFELPKSGTLLFRDSETLYELPLATSSASFRREWTDFNKRCAERRNALFARSGVKALTVSTEEDPVYELKRFFASRERQK